MNLKHKSHVLIALLMLFTVAAQGQQAISDVQQIVSGNKSVFRFAPGDTIFRASFKNNEQAIDHLSRSIRAFRDEIESGQVKIRIEGFWSAEKSSAANLRAAKHHSNQIKSYFIVTDSVRESHFRTSNYIRVWNGQPDVVATAYLFRVADRTVITPTPAQLEAQDSPDTNIIYTDTEQDHEENLNPATEPKPQQSTHPATQTLPQTIADKHPDTTDPTSGRWAIKTNVAYLAATVANLGFEYSFGTHYSVDIPIIYSPYTIARNYRLRFLVVQPEFRYWTANPMKGHFFGVHLNIGAFNISVDNNNRYQSPDGFYGAGISYGYALPFAPHWIAEFTIGAGCIYTRYDTYYNIPNGARYRKGTPYDYWGLTRVGINLAYRFGK